MSADQEGAALALTAGQLDLIRAADRGALTFIGGWFLLDGYDPAVVTPEARELVFAGMLVKDGSAVKATAAGRAVLAVAS